MGLFSLQDMHTPRRLFAPRLTQMSFFKYNLTVVKVAFLLVVECSSNVELDLTHFWTKNTLDKSQTSC
jgi:hypothetical protein